MVAVEQINDVHEKLVTMKNFIATRNFADGH
jgi:hypothetical protein